MRLSVKNYETGIDKLHRFQHAMQSDMQDKLKKAYQTVKSAPDDSESLAQYSFVTENADFKAGLE